jgi:hypothetical protein
MTSIPALTSANRLWTEFANRVFEDVGLLAPSWLFMDEYSLDLNPARQPADRREWHFPGVCAVPGENDCEWLNCVQLQSAPDWSGRHNEDDEVQTAAVRFRSD